MIFSLSESQSGSGLKFVASILDGQISAKKQVGTTSHQKTYLHDRTLLQQSPWQRWLLKIIKSRRIVMEVDLNIINNSTSCL